MSYRRNVTIGVVLISIGLLGIFIYNFNVFGLVDMNRAEDIANQYLNTQNNADLAIDEIMEFEHNFYVVYYEKSTDIGAYEMLIDKQNGHIFPEYGPNMMWNLKYGHGGMMGNPRRGGYSTPNITGDPLNETESVNIAQEFLDETYPGSIAEDPHPFYGYYTIHTMLDGEIFGMLSVNQYTGDVWYHNWHGEYINSFESH